MLSVLVSLELTRSSSDAEVVRHESHWMQRVLPSKFKTPHCPSSV